MRSSVSRSDVFRITEGIFASITDIVLAQMFFILNTVGARGPYEILRAQEEASELVQHEINYYSIKNALYKLSRQGLIKFEKKHTHPEISITDEGRRKINSYFPAYRTQRPWDGYLYLLSYDIPVNANRKRNILRLACKRLGCGLLQESLWISPYNPKANIAGLVEEEHIPGTILVSKIGHDGSIGDEPLSELIHRVYRLNELDDKYAEFMEKYQHHKGPAMRLSLSVDYFSVLKDDPQLPFELEPKNFQAKAAYKLYQSLLI